MAEDKMMRLSQVARILNVGITTIVDHLSAKGYKVESNPNTKINSDQIDFLAKDFKSDDLKASWTPRSTASEPVAEIKEEKLKSDVDGILYFRNSPAKPIEEKPQVEEKAEPAPSAFENRLPGIKVVGKIDLDANKRPAPACPAQPEPVKETVQEVKVETPPAPQPVAETPKPEVKAAEPVKEVPQEVKKETQPVVTPPVENIIIEQPKKEIVAEKEVVVEKPEPTPVAQPVAEVKPPTLKEESKPVETAVKETTPPITPIAESKTGPESNAVAPESNESELIEARGEQLRGLRVVGKIELPSDRAKKKDPVASSDSATDKKRRRKRKRIRDGAAPEVKPAVAGATTTPATGTGTPSTPSAPGNRDTTTATEQEHLIREITLIIHVRLIQTTQIRVQADQQPEHQAQRLLQQELLPEQQTAQPDPQQIKAARTIRRGGKREEVSDKEVSDNIKATMARMGGGNSRTATRGKGLRRRDRGRSERSKRRRIGRNKSIARNRIRICKRPGFLDGSDGSGSNFGLYEHGYVCFDQPASGCRSDYIYCR